MTSIKPITVSALTCAPTSTKFADSGVALR